MTTPDTAPRRRWMHALWADVVGVTPVPAGETWAQVWAVDEVCPPGEVYTAGPLDALALFLTHAGRAQVQVGAHTLAHQPGSLVVIPSGSALREQVDAGHQPWHVRYLLLSGPWAMQMDSWLRRRPDSPFLVCAPTPFRRQVFAEIVDLALEEADGWQWRFLSGSAEILSSLYSDAVSDASEDTLLTQIARFVDGAPSARPTMDEIAAHVGLTARQLLYRFMETTGETPGRWLRRHRISAARRLLAQGLSVSAVSDQLGYANPYHFARVFKSLSGIPPSVFRETALQGRLHVREDNQANGER